MSSVLVDAPGERSGIFLTASGLQRARAVFDLYNSTHEKLREARSNRWFKDAGFHDEAIAEAAAFDDWYVGLYLLRLTGQDHIKVRSENVSTDLREMFRLRTMHNFSLGASEKPQSFSETLIDEHTVADVMLFASAVKHLVPYEVHMRSIETGCLWFEFGVYGYSKNRTEDLPFLKKSDIEASAADTEHPGWAALKRRFKIEASELLLV